MCQEIIEEKSIPKNIYQRISKETFPAKGLERGISSKNILKTCLPKSVCKQFLCQKLSEEKSMPNKQQKLPPKKNWKKHFYGKLSEEKSLQNNFQNKSLPRNIWRQNLLYQKIFKRNLYQKIFEDKFLPKYVGRNFFWQTRCEGKLSTKQTLNRNPVQTNSERNLYQREFDIYIYIFIYLPIKHFLKENLYEQIFEEKSLPRKNLSKNVSTNTYLKRFYQGSFEETFPAKNWRETPTKKSLKRHFLSKKIGKYMSTKKTSEEKSLPNKLKKHLHQNICKQTIITRNMAKIRTDEILGKNVLLN